MISTRIRTLAVAAVLLTLGGCASGVYAPPGGNQQPTSSERQTESAPQPPEAGARSDRERLSEQPQTEPEKPAIQPGYRDQGDDLSPAAVSLIQQADQLLAQGNAGGAITQLERAQRISPRSAAVYFKLSEAYVESGNLGAAEQFVLKGLSLSGSDTRLQRSGWNLLADVRRARGNVAGADQAQSRADQL